MKRFLQRKNTWMYHVWLRSFMVCLCLALAGVSAWGQDSFGDFDVTGETKNAAYENGILTISGSGVTVKNKTPETATSDRIVIKGGEEASPIEVIFAGVNIEGPTIKSFDGYPAVKVSENSYIKLTLKEENILKGSECSFVNTAALSVSSNAHLEITGDGKLTTNAKNIGIGGDALKNQEPSTRYSITISGGEIHANTTNSGESAAIGGYGNNISININGGKIFTSTSSGSSSWQEAWGIGGNDCTINISGGEINTSKAGCGIGGENSTINITSGIININTSNGGQVGLGSMDKSSNITIEGGYIIIDNSLSSTGNAHGTSIQGKLLSTGEKGNAIIIAKSSNKKDEDVILESVNKDNWNMILLEYPKSNSNKEIDVEGYVYGNVSLEQDFIIEEDYSLIIDPKSEFTLNNYTVINNGRIYFAYEKQSLKNSISTENGNRYFQVFYDLAGIPEELKEGILTNQYIESDGKIEKKEMYSTKDPFLFAKKGDQVTLKWKDDVRQSPLPVYNGWILKSFKVKKTATGESIPVDENLTFTMSDESITIYDIQLEKRKYEINTKLPIPKGFEVFYENENGEVITESVWGEDVYVVITAPGYAGLTVEGVKYQSSIFGSATTDVEQSGNKYKFEMPKFDTQVKVDGTATDQKTFKLSIDDCKNGEIKVTYGEDVTEGELHYKDLINVAAEPDEGYGLKSLVYSYEENGSPVTKDIENGSFTMPAADVTISATFAPIQYQVRIDADIQHGVVVATPQTTAAGSVIKLTVTPETGYQIKELYYKEEGSEEAFTINNNSFEMPAADVTVYATFEAIKYQVSISGDIENGTVTASPTEATVGETITLTVTPNNGYQLDKLYYIATGTTTEVPITGMTFTMPAANVTVYATFTEKEDPTDPEEPVDPPVDPTKYYNIYDVTEYDFIDVSFSRNVVREGGSVNVYLRIPEGLDPAAVTLMFKRGMYYNWETLDEGVQPGEYPINNIWSDIYVKAVVDESYIDPNPDENHIYIDLSETNDSIWLYTERKLVEEGKSAVIQAEVAKSCQNKEICYMYKRTVLGEWKEMPKDYSINQYVVRDITTDIYVKAYFVFDKQDPTTAKNPHHVYADITATCEGLYLDATRHKVADEGDTKVFLYVKKGFETKDARYQFKRGLKGEWEDLVPGIEQNTFQVTDIEGDIYLKGIDAVYTGTEDIDGMVRVYTKDGSLFVYTAQPEEISVVSMTGVTVKRTRQTGLQSYPLNQGIYVVRVGEQVFKVRVK